MTVTIKSTSINNKYIEISQDKYSNVYTVSESIIYASGFCGNTQERTYSTMTQANRRYNKLIQEAKR